MQFAQLEIELPAELLDEADALLELLGASSLTRLPASTEEILEPEPGASPPWARTRIRALFAGELDLTRATALLRGQFGPAIPIRTTTLADAQWRDVLSVEPVEIEIGGRLLIAGPDGASPSDERVVVRLARGLGFGTGTHPTTRLCLEWLESAELGDRTVLDYGCGSGVLAITALRLGAAAAWAVDIEPQAIVATHENAALNDVTARLWAGQPDGLPTRRFDVIVANILADPLITLAPRLATLTAPGGVVVLSGLLPAQIEGVSAAYRRFCGRLATVERDGWLRLVACQARG